MSEPKPLVRAHSAEISSPTLVNMIVCPFAGNASGAGIGQEISEPIKNRIGSCQTWLFQTWLFAFLTRKRSFAPFCALLRPFALFLGLAFELFCEYVGSFALIYVFLHLTAFRTTALLFVYLRKKPARMSGKFGAFFERRFRTHKHIFHENFVLPKCSAGTSCTNVNWHRKLEPRKPPNWRPISATSPPLVVPTVPLAMGTSICFDMIPNPIQND